MGKITDCRFTLILLLHGTVLLNDRELTRDLMCDGQKLTRSLLFTTRRSYASAVLGVVILSVPLSVRRTRAL